jgi:hypothetical protein
MDEFVVYVEGVRSAGFAYIAEATAWYTARCQDMTSGRSGATRVSLVGWKDGKRFELASMESVDMMAMFD